MSTGFPTRSDTKRAEQRLEMTDLGRRGIVLSAADLRLCFRICKKQVFS